MKTIVGERINSTRKPIRHAIDNRDAGVIEREARMQQEKGATHIDVNAGGHGRPEQEDLLWLIDVVQRTVDLHLCIDSADPQVIAGVFSRLTKRPIINSVSLERQRMAGMAPFLTTHDCDIVGLCMSDEGVPQTAEKIVARAQTLVRTLEEMGINRDQIHIDPLIQPIGTNHQNGRTVLQAIQGILETCPGVHLICGLTNISFGMPERKQINRCLLTLLMAGGLDGVILDPLDENLMKDLVTNTMLLGKDPYCLNYIKACKGNNN